MQCLSYYALVIFFFFLKISLFFFLKKVINRVSSCIVIKIYLPKFYQKDGYINYQNNIINFVY
ncbi:hypothetical protein SDAV_001581 [Spiroplasma phoeniceum P40]|uniref:Uncharacterized protein n=1 Tax=Spiroplasma phoeniceum P40 TaxID=1276259 RepID=A0A345DQQ5_9MOLU|nr:hypothetical protein SDAV_001581 [Spiroplasma phoeniceum P40]